MKSITFCFSATCFPTLSTYEQLKRFSIHLGSLNSDSVFVPTLFLEQQSYVILNNHVKGRYYPILQIIKLRLKDIKQLQIYLISRLVGDRPRIQIQTFSMPPYCQETLIYGIPACLTRQAKNARPHRSFIWIILQHCICGNGLQNMR